MWDEYAQNPDKAPEWVNQYMNFIFDLEDASGKPLTLSNDLHFLSLRKLSQLNKARSEIRATFHLSVEDQYKQKGFKELDFTMVLK